jgi:hypothetical protein
LFQERNSAQASRSTTADVAALLSTNSSLEEQVPNVFIYLFLFLFFLDASYQEGED